MMNESLFHLLEKPTLWQRGTDPFWDDDHISREMLKAHLNPDWDAASRKHSTIDASAKWLCSIIAPGASVLDIGCGPGLYTKRLSNMGYAVTGIDCSRRSIAYAKSHDAKTEYLCMNYLELDYRDAFDAVLLIYCDYAALTPDERATLIPKVFAALRPGGLFILDAFTGVHFAKKSNRKSWSLNKNGGFWSAEPHICLEASYLYEENTVSVDQYVIVTAGGIKRYLNWDAAYTPEKLAEEAAPFALSHVFDDVCGSPYTGAAETLCAVLRKS